MVSSGPKMLPSEILRTSKVLPCEVYRTFAFDEANHLRNRILRWGRVQPIYLKTHYEHLIDCYATVDVTLAGPYLTLILPSPANETIEIEFTTSDVNFREAKRMLDIILQKSVAEQDQEDTNQKVAPIRAFPLLR